MAVPSGAIQPLGTKPDFSKFDLGSAYTKSLTPASSFYELEWCQIEPSQGQLDWSTVDGILDKAASVNTTMMLKIRTGTCWSTVNTEAKFGRGQKGKTESSMPNDLSQYAGFVTALVKRYAPRGVHVYAIENEINSPSFWSGSTSDYEKLLATATTAIKAADPSASVADPGISSVAYGAGIAKRLLDAGQGDAAVQAWNTYYARRIGTRGATIPRVTSTADLTAALAINQNARNLEYLALAQHLAADKLVDIRQVHFYEPAAAAQLFMDYLKATTPASVPIEAWEVGQFMVGGTLTAAQRSDEMVKTISVILAAGARLVLWLPLTTAGSGAGEDTLYGLLSGTGQTQDTAIAFAAMSKVAAGARATPVDKAGLSGVLLERSGSTTAYVWATSDVATKALSLPSGSAAVDPATGAAETGAITDQARQITAPTSAAALLARL